jgi:hypothetical protein
MSLGLHHGHVPQQMANKRAKTQSIACIQYCYRILFLIIGMLDANEYQLGAVIVG